MPQNILNNIEFHNLLFQHSTSYIWVRDLEGKYLAANQSFLDFLSLPLEGVIGKTNFDLHPPTFAQETAKDDEFVIKSKISSIKEVKLEYKGNEFIFLVVKFPLINNNKDVYAVAGCCTDISKEKTFSNILEQKENLLSSIINSMSDGLIFFDSQGKMKVINAQAKKILRSIGLLGSIKEMYKRLKFFSIKGKKLRIPHKKLPWTLALEGKPVIDQEFEAIDVKDKETRQISITAMPVRNSKNEMLGAAVMFRDITQRNIFYREMKRQAKELKLKNEALEQFSYFVTHDLREPLRTINSFIHILNEELSSHKDLNPSLKKYISFIQEGSRNVDRMLNDLIKFCEKSDSSLASLVNLDECLKKAIEFLDAFIKENKAKIHCIPLPMIRGNETSFVLLFQNLIINAIKYRSNAFPEIFITLEKKPHSYIIGVKDNGIGIDSQYFREIFLPFKRVSTNNQLKGSGIGLSLCKKIVEEHEGKIWVESKVDEGSHFKFKLKRMEPLQQENMEGNSLFLKAAYLS